MSHQVLQNQLIKRVNWGLLGLALCVAAGAYLRLRGLETSWVGPDQSIMFSIAMRWVNGGMIPLAANKASAGIMNPPLIEYVLALPLFFKATVLWATQFYAFLALLGVPILYWYLHRLFGWRVALLAALFFAVNPWAVNYSRVVWNPGPILLFGTLLLCSLLAFFAGRGHPIHLSLSFLWLAAVTQLHLSGLILGPIIALLGVLFWRRWRMGNWLRSLAPWLIGLALFWLLYAPYLLYQRGTGFGDLRAMVDALAGGRSSATGQVDEATVNDAAWLLNLELATGDHIFGSAHDFDAREVWRGAVWPWFPLIPFAYLLFVAGALYAVAVPLIWRSWPATRSLLLPTRPAALAILALWIILPVLAYLRHTVYLQNYYFLYLFPAPFILTALLVDDLLTAAGRHRFGRWIQVALLVPVVLLVVWQFHIFQVRFELADTVPVEAERQAQHVDRAAEVSRAVLDRLPGCDLIIADTAGYLERAPLGLLEDFIHPRPVRYVETGRGIIMPSGCAVYLVAQPDPWLESWLGSVATVLPEVVETQSDTWRYYYVPAGSGPAADAPLAVWDNGLQLLEATVEGNPAAGGQLHLQYRLLVTQAQPPETHYHFFNHFWDETAGQLITQDDAPGVHALYWRPGDQLLTHFALNLPPDLAAGRYLINMGLYHWPSLERVGLGATETLFTVTTIEIR